MSNLPDNWQQVKLGDYLTVLTDYHANGSYKLLKANVELLDTPDYAVMIRTKNLEKNDFQDNLKYVSKSAYEFLEKSKVYPEDILMNKIASAGSVYLMPDLKRPISLAMNLFLLRTNQEKTSQKFIYFYLKANEGYIKQFATGTAATTITKNAVRELEILLPPLPEQKAIASILSSLDDKIELNQQMNQTLEAIARAIFKSWFVDFDPVRAKMAGNQPVGMDAATANLFPDSFEESALGLIPKGWTVKGLGSLAQNFSKTFDFSTHEQVTFINTGDILSGVFLRSNLVSKNGLPGQAKKSIDKNDILLSEIRPANKRYAFVDFDASNYVVSTRFMILRAFDTIEPKLLYRILTLQSSLAEFQIVAESRSGTFPQITFDSISYFPIILAPKSIQISFLNLISPLEKQIKQNNLQSRTLANIRDTLLPKLMSADIKSIKV